MSKVAVVGVVGRTNAGKSTLVNRLVGEKVSIVSPVEQTTRNTVRGIVEDPRGQLVLLDTPGLHKAVGELGRILNRMARRSAAGVDILCVVFDASEEPQLEDIGWMQRVAKERPEKVVFVLNKADCSPFYETMFRDAWKEAVQGAGCLVPGAGCLVPGAGCLVPGAGVSVTLETPVASTAHQAPSTAHQAPSTAHQAPSTAHQAPSTKHQAPTWVKAIATTEGGANPVMDALFAFAEEGERLFDADIVTDYPRKLAIADSIREKYLAKMHQEVPHEMGILVKTVREERDKWEVKADILVNRVSQKPIVIGRGATTIKYVRKCAERELSDMFGVKVELELWVRVEPNWMKNPKLLAEMGYMGELV